MKQVFEYIWLENSENRNTDFFQFHRITQSSAYFSFDFVKAKTNSDNNSYEVKFKI